MEAKTRTRRHLSVQAWGEVLRRFDDSGESVTGFCKREGLHTSSFRRWRQRLATSMRATCCASSAATSAALSTRWGCAIDMDAHRSDAPLLSPRC